MPIPYPSSPTVGQTFTYGGITYTWNGVAWTYVQTSTTGVIGSVLVNAPITNSGTPTAPVIGINQTALLIDITQVSGLVSALANKANLYGGNSFTEAQTITGSVAASTVLKIIPATGQSTDILQIRNSADSANLFQIGSGGAITTASALTVNGSATFNQNTTGYGTHTQWANQQLSLAVRNGTNAATNLVQYSRNDTTVNGGRGPTGSIWTGATAPENNNSYNLTTGVNPYVSSSQATFTISTTLAWQPFAVNQKIIITGCNISQYNGSWIVTAVGGSANAWTCTITAGGTSTPFTNTGLTITTGSIQMEPALFVRTPSPGSIGLLLKASGATGGNHTDIMRYYDGTGALKTYITAAGDFVAPAISAIWSITSSAQDVTVNAMRARTSVASGYRANLQTWESSSTVLAGVNSPGKIFTGATSPVTTAVGGTIQSIASGANPLVTMASAHGLAVGEVVTLAGTTGGTYNGNFYVATVPASTTFTITSSLTTGQAGAAGTVAVPAQLSVVARSAGTIGQVIRAATSQTANLQEWQDSTGAVKIYANASGDMFMGSLGLGFTTPYSAFGGALLGISTVGASNRGIVVRGVASQTANLQEWQNSAGGTVTAINADGGLVVGSTHLGGATPGLGQIRTSTNTGLNYVDTTANDSPSTGPGYTARRARGTLTAPTQVLSGDLLFGIFAQGYNNAGGFGGNSAALRMLAGENFTSTALGSIIAFETASTGTTGRTERMRITSSGVVSVNTTSDLAQLGVVSGAAATIGVVIRGAASQSANLTEWQDSAGTTLTRINNGGIIVTNAKIIAGATTGVLGTLSVYANDASTVGSVVRGATSQSADLQQWQNSGGTVRARVNSNGDIKANNVSSINSFMQITENAGGALQVWGKGTATAGSPGANFAYMYFRDGTTAGTLKFVAKTGASGVEETIVDNLSSTGSTAGAQFTGAGGVATTGTVSSAGLSLTGTASPITLNGSVGTSGQVLTSGGAGATPTWTTVSGGGSFTGGTLTSNLTLDDGTTTSAPLTFQTGTNLTTVVSGAREYDGTVFYQTSNTNPGRALDTQNYYYASSSDYGPDFTVNSTAKSLLGGSTTGITVAAGTTYEYELYTAISHQYVTTGSISGDYLIVSTTVSGSPTVAVTHQVDYGSNTTGFTTATTLSTVRPTGNVTFMPAITSGTRYAFLRAKGLIRVTGTGTVKIYPAMQTSGTSGSGDNIWNVRSGTVFKMTPIGNGTVTTVGSWA